MFPNKNLGNILSVDKDWLRAQVREAVKSFWSTRNGGDGVLAGKTLHAFLAIIEHVVQQNGLPDAHIYSGKNSAQLPGFFRPHKTWDAVVIADGRLVAVIELKSQVGSIGNNFNNRTEEVLGSGVDLKYAIEEEAFGPDADIFIGYLALIEMSEATVCRKERKGKMVDVKVAGTMTTPCITMTHFPVMDGFLYDEAGRDDSYRRTPNGYPKATGISYLNRYDVMCKRLMLKKLYSAASIIAAPTENLADGTFLSVSPETSIEMFMSRLANHCQIAGELIDAKRQILFIEDSLNDQVS